jgi:hypothetical protein
MGANPIRRGVFLLLFALTVTSLSAKSLYWRAPM